MTTPKVPKAKTSTRKACPACGASMRRETRTDSVEYKGHRKTFDATGWWCMSCDEAIFEGPELEVAERVFVELRAEVESVLLPEEITAIRQRLNLSQREAGKILGGGTRAFQKYEAGSVPVSAPMNNLLLLLSVGPERLEELRHLLRTKATARAKPRTPKPRAQPEPRRGGRTATGRVGRGHAT